MILASILFIVGTVGSFFAAFLLWLSGDKKSAKDICDLPFFALLTWASIKVIWFS